jgi:hypothetical protein
MMMSEKIVKYREVVGVIISLLTAVTLVYKMAVFVSQIDARLAILEASNKEMTDDMKTLVKDQAKQINANTTELKIFEEQTHAFEEETQLRLNHLELVQSNVLLKYNHNAPINPGKPH